MGVGLDLFQEAPACVGLPAWTLVLSRVTLIVRARCLGEGGVRAGVQHAVTGAAAALTPHLM